MDTDQVSEVPATQKRSNEELEDLELPSAENATNGLDNAPKKARIDHEDEGDTNGDEDSNSKNMEIDSENADLPSTKQAGDLEAALERAKQYAMQVQEELVKAGALSSATEAEPSLVVSNTVEQRKSLCRVYVGSISFEATEEDVRQKLGRFGAIRELVLKVDPLSGKHRGFCFVEYELPEASILAVQASESVEVVGRHLKIGRPKNYDAKAIHELPPPPEDRIYVANIGSLVTESDLSTIFQAFGPVEECSLTPDPVTRKHKGYG
ncbi:Poly(U)-binding-splicing factor puf60, partial [Lunasporangiospora selenospora]